MIREALLSAIDRPRPRYKSSGKMRLWVSELGYCPRKAMLRITGREPTGEFPVKIKEVMSLGNSYEDNTFAWLKRYYGPRITQGVPVGDENWSGKIDFLLTHCNETAGGTSWGSAIIEHKAQGGKWFDFNQNLPRLQHVCQAWLYGHLLEKKYPLNSPPKIILFYRAWGNYAEFEIVPHEGGVRAQGVMNDEEVSRWLWVKPDEKRLELEEWFLRNEVPPLPEGGPSGDCLFRGEPSCSFYDLCWEGG